MNGIVAKKRMGVSPEYLLGKHHKHHQRRTTSRVRVADISVVYIIGCSLNNKWKEHTTRVAGVDCIGIINRWLNENMVSETYVLTILCV